MDHNFEFFRFLHEMTDTQDELIVFTLTLIMIAMVLDFLTGTFAAKINPNINFVSKAGINGIIRKVASIALLAFCIPLSVLLPEGIGLVTLQVLYLGYLYFELKSIIENLNKLGIDTELFMEFIKRLDKKKEEDDDNSK